jgi:hypothetical protein
MKYVLFAVAISLSACAVSPEAELAARLEAERDFHAHQAYIESLYTTYDPEYIDDCLYYNLDCGL